MGKRKGWTSEKSSLEKFFGEDSPEKQWLRNSHSS
jgi:hypothetical protein